MRAERLRVTELPAWSVTVFETVVGGLAPWDSAEAVSVKLASAAALRPERASEAVKLADRSVFLQVVSLTSAPEITGAVLSILKGPASLEVATLPALSATVPELIVTS